MIIMHHLRVGRSIFTVWLLEELGLEYDLKVYLRDPKTGRAGEDLKQAHPLGKSPVIEDGDLLLSESGAITAYLIDTYDKEGRFAPPRSDREAFAKYLQWLHYSEGSAVLPLMMKLVASRQKEPAPVISAYAAAEAQKQLDYIRDSLGNKPYLMGDNLQGPDFGMGFILNFAGRLGELEPYPALAEYVKRVKARPAYQKAIERAVE